MTDKEKQEIRTKIRAELDSLEKSILTITELVEDDDVEPDSNDWYMANEKNPAKEINEYSLDKARKRVIILNAVLEKMEKPDFGICIICGKPIPFGRMKAVPTSVKCISCP